MRKSRRNFIRQSTAVSLGFIGLQTYLGGLMMGCNMPNNKTKQSTNGKAVSNSLVPDPEGLLNLPKGFSYKIICQAGLPMSDSYLYPDKPDGMATFAAPDGSIILIRNHELLPWNNGPFGAGNNLIKEEHLPLLYDGGNGRTICAGGTTTLLIDEKSLEIKRSFLSLCGTIRNCAGGPTPWNSWITCEESVMKTGQRGLVKDHGYNFEVPADHKSGLVKAEPIIGMGRFNHEAVCVEPNSGIVYQTEDRDDGLIYRYLPNVPGHLLSGGKLQALSIQDKKSADTRNWSAENFPVNLAVAVEWIDIQEVTAPEDQLRYQGFEKGAAKFARGEGMWYGNDEVYFACTSGGQNRTGQVFKYIPSIHEGTAREGEAPGILELYLEPNDSSLLRNCDNLTVAPWGDVVLCEDNDHPYIVGVGKQGNYYRIAENIGFESEFAGGVFSPSGNTFLVNIQHAGLTLAIQGPWNRFLL